MFAIAMRADRAWGNRHHGQREGALYNQWGERVQAGEQSFSISTSKTLSWPIARRLSLADAQTSF